MARQRLACRHMYKQRWQFWNWKGCHPPEPGRSHADKAGSPHPVRGDCAKLQSKDGTGGVRYPYSSAMGGGHVGAGQPESFLHVQIGVDSEKHAIRDAIPR